MDFAQFYQEGGAWMHPIAICAVLGAGVMIERFIFLFFRFNINGAQFFNQVQKLVMANNIDRAIKLCNAADKAALARVMKAGLATLLGLLGTIFGMIDAFNAVAVAAADQRSQALAKGISIAINTTGFGLMVAIPLLSAQVFIQGLAKKITDEVDLYSVKLENLLAARVRQG